MIFSSDKAGSVGKQDLWISYALPNGDWTPSVNLSKKINTIWDETHPTLSADGKTLYFASNGHNSMGGYDIFYSKWNESEKEWEKPINIGYPLNTTEDNLALSFSSNPKYAYTSCLRPEGLGDLDIYRVGFNNIKTLYTLIKGSILTPDSVNIVQYILNDTSNITPTPVPTTNSQKKGKINVPVKPIIKIPDMNFIVIDKNKKTENNREKF